MVVTPLGATLGKGCQLWGGCQSGKAGYITQRKELPKILGKLKKAGAWHSINFSMGALSAGWGCLGTPTPSLAHAVYSLLRRKRVLSIRELWSHGQVTSGRSSDDGLCSKMDFVILIVRLTIWECQDLLLSGQAMLLDCGVVDTTAIDTTPNRRSNPRTVRKKYYLRAWIQTLSSIFATGATFAYVKPQRQA